MIAALIPAQLIASVGATTSNTAYIYRWLDSDSQLVASETRYVNATKLQDLSEDLQDLNSGWYYSQDYIEFNKRVNIHGTVNIIICEEGGSYVKFKDGIHVSPGNTLNIYGQRGETQALEAIAETNDYAGIGGNGNEGSGTINIYGGKVTAKADVDGAGIGGGDNGDGGHINIYGGTITATGGSVNTNGGGKSGSSGTIEFNGGIVVTGNGGINAAGIGGGDEGEGGDITIKAGHVDGFGGSVNSDGGAGIGGGNEKSGGKISILGGDVRGIGGCDAAGIGGGDYGEGGNITIANNSFVRAEGGKYGAGIGGGQGKDGGKIRITSTQRKVQATGSEYGAGIGGGESGSGGEITISNVSNVIADGGNYAAGIGGGDGADGGTITIDGGNVTAQGGNDGAGIGGGEGGGGGSITIKAGTIGAESHRNAAGIGGGEGAVGGTITISGGTTTVKTPDGQQSLNGTSITLSDDSTAFKGICVKKPDGSIAPKADRISWCTSTANRTLMIMSCEHDGVNYRDNNQGVHTKTCPHCSCVADESHTYDEPVWDWAEDKQSATATFTCEKCGHNKTVDATITKTVDFDGMATYTATAEINGKSYTDTMQVPEDALDERVVGYSISLDGDIGVNFYMELSDAVVNSETAYVHFTIPKDGEPDTQEIKVSEARTVKSGDKTYHVFKCQVAAKEMTSDIKAQIIDGDRKGMEYTYSVKDYADYLLAHTDDSAEFAKAAPSVKALLNYGAYTQIYFDKNPDKLANVGLTEEEKALGEVSITVADYDVSGLPEGVRFGGATLSLKSETTLSLYFKSDDDLVFSCGDYFVQDVPNGEYQVARIRGIKATDIGDVFTLNVSGAIVKYSPLNYIKNALEGGTDDVKLQNAVKALYLYWDAANMYFEGVDLSTVTGNIEVQDGGVITGTLSGNHKISIADGATVRLRNADITSLANNEYVADYAGITLLGDATIILEGSNTVRGGEDSYPGIYVPVGKTLTIDGNGSLDASSQGYACGIGGGTGLSCGNITINGGNITATGGYCDAGIGSGKSGSSSSSCGNITINGGTVTAKGGDYGAGIGTGYYTSCGNITINGGTVTAIGGVYADGIGCGYGGHCGNITINNTVSQVTTTGGIGVALGGGSCGTVTIGGVITGSIKVDYTYRPE